MTDKQYNLRRNECRENSCYHCSCNGTPKCYKDDFKKIVKDFPERDFNQLSEKEKKKVLEMEVK
jgi:hypothetical protein